MTMLRCFHVRKPTEIFTKDSLRSVLKSLLDNIYLNSILCWFQWDC